MLKEWNGWKRLTIINQKIMKNDVNEYTTTEVCGIVKDLFNTLYRCSLWESVNIIYQLVSDSFNSVFLSFLRLEDRNEW